MIHIIIALLEQSNRHMFVGYDDEISITILKSPMCIKLKG